MGAWALGNYENAAWTSHDADNGTYSGCKQSPAANAWVTAVRYWRDGPLRSAPDAVGIWDWTAGAWLVSAMTPSDDGNTGWQVTQLPSPVAVVGGRSYTVCYHFGTGGGNGRLAYTSPFPKGPIGVTLLPHGSYSEANASLDFTAAGGNDSFLGGFDMYFEWGPGGDASYPSLSQTDLDAAFERWLTTGGSRYTGNAVQLQREVVDANNEGINGLLASIPEAFSTEWTTVRDTIGSWLTTEADWYKKLVHDTAPGAASLLDKVGDYTGITLFEYLAQLIRFANGLENAPLRDTSTDYDLVDSTPFDTNLAWDVPADVYTVEIDTFDPAGTSEPFGSFTRYGYLAKWSILDVDRAAEWHFFNTTKARLEVPHGTMPGLALIMYRPGTGTVTAWKLKTGA